jgi:hypothetical protein
MYWLNQKMTLINLHIKRESFYRLNNEYTHIRYQVCSQSNMSIVVWNSWVVCNKGNSILANIRTFYFCKIAIILFYGGIK